MSDVELNKKLAEWAGFEFNADWSQDNPYKDPNGVILQDWEPFTESLDACFKWLVPKLRGEMEKEHPNGIDGRHYVFMVLCTWLSRVLDGDDPALALCLAIEKEFDVGKEQE